MMLKINLLAYLQQTNAFIIFTNKISNLSNMADLEEIEDVAAGMATYGIMSSLVNRYGLLNVLFYGALIVTTVVFILIWLLSQIMNAGYEETWTKVKAGDKIYCHFEASDTGFRPFVPQILVRPINQSDIEKMPMVTWKKRKLINELDTNLKPLLIDAKIAFTKDSMYKYNTAYMGTFIKKDSIKNLKLGDCAAGADGDYWYTIKLDTTHVECCYESKIPNGYVLADKNYYVPAGWVRLQESSAFIKNKK